MVSYPPTALFRDRQDAGLQLAERLSDYKGKNNIVVFAIPRGGVPVAMEVAASLNAPLDIIIVRKIPIPHEPEAGYGAVTEDGTIVLNESMVKYLGLSKLEIESQADAVRSEIMRRSRLYRAKLSASTVKGKAVIIIDDGLASGYTMIAAIDSLRHRKASQIIVAVPVASGTAFDTVKSRADFVISVMISRTDRFAVASFYREWYDLKDDDILRYLENWGTTGRSSL